MPHVTFKNNRIWCDLCSDHNEFLKVQKAARLVDVDRRTIYRYIEEGKVLALRTAGGTYRVCGGCLIKSDLSPPALVSKNLSQTVTSGLVLK